MSSLEERMALALDSISAGVVFFDRDWRIVYLNRKAASFTAVDGAQVLGRVLWDVAPGLRESELGVAYLKAMDDQVSTVTRAYRERPDTWVEATTHPTPEGLTVLFLDLTEEELKSRRLRNQDALLESQAALLDNARDAFIVRGLDSEIQYWNAAATRIYGWTRDEVIGRLARDLLYSSREDFDLAISHTMRDGHWMGELRQVTKWGDPIIVDSSWTLVRDEEGEPQSIFSVNSDITEKKRAEQLALRTQRMESLGTLASGIAHDLNNVLTPILMAVQLLEPGEKAPERRELLNSMEAAVKRGADMIRQVLSFATGATGRRDPIDLAVIIAEASSLIRRAPDQPELDISIEPDLWTTTGDATQLIQVVMNLITNARDAMPEGGAISIRARNITLTDAYSSVSHLALPGPYVVLEVEDEGIGIPNESLAKIFEPFYTTKAAGAGTGLGLSTSLAVIRGHGGYMQAYSELGRGSLFRIHLPAEVQASPALKTAGPERELELPRGSRQLILVVDDEAAIRQMTRQTLEAFGYSTAVASNGAEAINLIESSNAPVALVLTDMAMPVMDGAATAAYLLREHPEIPVIAASGLNANGGVARAASSGVRFFLAKPYTTEQLLNAVHLALTPEEELA